MRIKMPAVRIAQGNVTSCNYCYHCQVVLTRKEEENQWSVNCVGDDNDDAKRDLVKSFKWWLLLLPEELKKLNEWARGKARDETLFIFFFREIHSSSSPSRQVICENQLLVVLYNSSEGKCNYYYSFVSSLYKFYITPECRRRKSRDVLFLIRGRDFM